jgi:beta-lactamase class A
MHRRDLFAIAASAITAPGARALGADSVGFGPLPGTLSFLIHVGQGGTIARIEKNPDHFLFVASAIKTFILARYLLDIEEKRLPADAWVPVNDSVRTLDSPVLEKLSGKTSPLAALAGMIGFSDNTATDLALGQVGPDRVRALIRRAGLGSVRIPHSTRRFNSYVYGAGAGVDLGWPGVKLARDNHVGPFEDPLNDVITLAGTARDFVSWYEQVLAGAFFTKADTLAKFKLLQTMGATPGFVPPDTAAYCKGGNTAFPPYYAICFTGQMIAGGDTPVTFCFTLNWKNKSETEPEYNATVAAFKAGVQSILGSIKASL